METDETEATKGSANMTDLFWIHVDIMLAAFAPLYSSIDSTPNERQRKEVRNW